MSSPIRALGATYTSREPDGSLACWRVIAHRPLLTPPGMLGIVVELYALYPPGTAQPGTPDALPAFDARDARQ